MIILLKTYNSEVNQISTKHKGQPVSGILCHPLTFLTPLFGISKLLLLTSLLCALYSDFQLKSFRSCQNNRTKWFHQVFHCNSLLFVAVHYSGLYLLICAQQLADIRFKGQRLHSQLEASAISILCSIHYLWLNLKLDYFSWFLLFS